MTKINSSRKRLSRWLAKSASRLTRLTRSAVLLGMLVLGAGTAKAQTEIPPPHGKGPVVALVSGHMGPDYYAQAADQIAALGYDVILLDGNALDSPQGPAALKQAIKAVTHAPHGLPGKIGVIGFSLGGREALAYATQRPDLFSVVIVWYPATNFLKGHIRAFVASLKVPVLIFAGGQDVDLNCCMISTARALAKEAAAQHVPLTLVTYPNDGHAFFTSGDNYDAVAAADSLRRAQKELTKYLAH